MTLAVMLHEDGSDTDDMANIHTLQAVQEGEVYLLARLQGRA